jgi:hypothetical protein
MRTFPMLQNISLVIVVGPERGFGRATLGAIISGNGLAMFRSAIPRICASLIRENR